MTFRKREMVPADKDGNKKRSTLLFPYALLGTKACSDPFKHIQICKTSSLVQEDLLMTVLQRTIQQKNSYIKDGDKNTQREAESYP